MLDHLSLLIDEHRDPPAQDVYKRQPLLPAIPAAWNPPVLHLKNMPSDPLPTAKMPDRSVRLPTSSHRKRPLQSALSQGTGSLASSCSGRTVSVYSVSSSSPNLLRSCILLSFLRYILMEMYVPPSVSICIISRLWIVRSVPAHSRTRKSRASLLQKALYGSEMCIRDSPYEIHYSSTSCAFFPVISNPISSFVTSSGSTIPVISP